MTEDPKLLWQDQPKEGPEMGLEQVRARLRAHEARVLRARVLMVAVALAAIGIMAFVASATTRPGVLVGEALLMGGVVVAMVLSWRRLSAPPPGDDAAACVAFLRARLLVRRRTAQGGWAWIVAPMIPGMAVTLAVLTSAAGSLWLSRMGPILALFGLWVLLTVLLQRREGAKVSAELREIDRLNLG